MNREEKDGLARAAMREASRSDTGWWRASCPFCVYRLGKPDRRGSFSINVRTGIYHCFRCAVTGRMSGTEFVDPALLEAVSEVPQMTPPPGFIALGSPDAQAMCVAAAWRYLDSRGLARDRAQEAGIGACPSGPYAGRVIVPVLAEDRSWLWWVGRAWTKQSEKPYMYPKGSRADVLYNHPAILEETDTPLMVVEGVFDALALWPVAVAVLGKPSEAQVEALASARRPVAIVLDGDAHEEGMMLALRLQLEGQRAGNVRLPPRLDPDEIPMEALMRAAKKSIGLTYSADID